MNSCRANQKESRVQELRSGRGRRRDAVRAARQAAEHEPDDARHPLEELRSEVDGLRASRSRSSRRAQDLDPPGPLVEQQEELVETMQLRVNGLQGLSQAFARVGAGRTRRRPAGLLAQQYAAPPGERRRLRRPVQGTDGARARRAGRDRRRRPGLELRPQPRAASPAAWELIVKRLTTSPQAGGLHGNGIAARACAARAGRSSREDEDNTVGPRTASPSR